MILVNRINFENKIKMKKINNNEVNYKLID